MEWEELTSEEYLANYNSNVTHKNTRNQKQGSKGESIARRLLRSIGFTGIEKIETGWSGKFTKQYNQITIKNAFAISKVSGDFRCIIPDGSGRNVHVEVKTFDKGNFTLSKLAQHQKAALDLRAKHNQICLVVWVRGRESKAIRWPIPGLKPRRGVSWEDVTPITCLEDLS